MANGSRPTDQDNGDKVSKKLEATSEQNSDGKLKLRPADQDNGDKASKKLEVTSAEDDVDSDFKTSKGSKYPEEFKSTLTKVEESIQDTILAAKEKLAEESGFTIKDQLGSLLESDGLNEQSKTKIVGIFESVVSLAAQDHLEKMTSILEETLDHAIESIQEQFDDTVSKYVNYALLEWTKENKLSIENGIRTQVAESFMSGLKNLLEEHYVNIPEDKLDLLKLESERSKSLEMKLNESLDKNIQLAEETKEFAKLLMIEKVVNSSNLTVIQEDKFRALSNSSEFVDVSQFKKLLEDLVSHVSNFTEKKSSNEFVTEDVNGGIELPKHESRKEDDNTSMSSYINFIKKTIV